MTVSCWGSEGHSEDKSRILGVSLYLVAVNDALIRFLEEGVEDNQFRIRVRSAAEFISTVGADYSQKLGRRHDKLSLTRRHHYGFHQKRQPQIRYVHFDVFRRFVEGHKYQSRVLDVINKLRSLLDHRIKTETKKKNAKLCLEFLYQFNATCLHQYRFYEPSIPRGIHKLLSVGKL